MTRTLLAALALACAVPLPASAGADSTYQGGCGYDAMTDPTDLTDASEDFVGRLYAQVVVYSPSSPATPVSATVTCHFRAADGTSYDASFSGTTVVAGSEEIRFTAQTTYDIGLCETVDFSDDTPTSYVCYGITTEGFPPEFVYDLLDATVFAALPGSKEALCAAVRAAEPALFDVWGTLLVNEDGDIYIGKYEYWRCP